MLLNRLEFALMNNGVRRFIQEKREVRELRRLSSLPPGKKILEIGCGSGHGTLLIQKFFSPREIQAIDLDPRMIEMAKRRINSGGVDKHPVNSLTSVTFQVASATKLPFPKNYFEAIIDFGVIHHIPDWQDALGELQRVLTPGGELILEDLSMESFSGFPGWLYQKTLDHPYAQMYTYEQFIEGLKKAGFTILHAYRYNPLGLLKYFVVVARKG